MTSAENICSLCMRPHVKFYHLKDSIQAPNHLRFEGHTNLQSVLEKILKKKREYSKASNEICQNCRDKLHGIYSFTHQHTESEKIFHQIADVTVRLKKLKTFIILIDLKTELGAIAETDKNAYSPECSSTVADIECDNSVVSKIVVKNECGSNFEGTDFSKLTKDLSVGLLGREYSNVADGRSDEQKKINSIGIADSEQITIGEEMIKGEYTMQEGEIFEAKTKRDILNRDQTKFSCDECNEVFATVSYFSEHTRIVHENDSQDFNQADAELNTKKEDHTQRHRYFHSKLALDDHKRAHCVALFECDMCDAEFKAKSSLEEHKLSHTNELLGCRYYCCNTKFTTNASLRHHRLSRICESCKCVQCNVKLSNKRCLRQHLKMVHSISNYSCDQCEKKFKYKHSLRVHKQWHAGVVFKCDHCDATYKSKQAFNEHRQIHSGILFGCDQCDGKYKSSSGLRQHKMSHAGITFACNQCDVSLSSKWNLSIHLRTVHTDAVFSCDHCDATYKSKQAVNEHKQSHSGILLNCDQCDAKYKSSASLRQHKISHTGITFACNQCDAKYKSSTGLRHKMSHAGITFACNQCDASLASKWNLRIHLRTAHTDAVFSCDHCDASFKTKQAFSDHKQIHNGTLFNCDKCDAKYKSSVGLKQHKMSHTGVTFTCSQCSASFSNKKCLANHLRGVHIGGTFSCEHCDATYKSKRALNTHTLSHHASQENFQLT